MGGVRCVQDNSDYVVAKAEIIWGYLVKFPSKPIPEKQTIVISIDAGLDNAEKATSQDIVKRITQMFILDNDNSEITIKVEYTELTWGVDILRHLENEIKNLLLNESSIAVMLRELLSLRLSH